MQTAQLHIDCRASKHGSRTRHLLSLHGISCSTQCTLRPSGERTSTEAGADSSSSAGARTGCETFPPLLSSGPEPPWMPTGQ